jgi:hypothetical protein
MYPRIFGLLFEASRSVTALSHVNRRNHLDIGLYAPGVRRSGIHPIHVARFFRRIMVLASNNVSTPVLVACTIYIVGSHSL